MRPSVGYVDEGGDAPVASPVGLGQRAARDLAPEAHVTRPAGPGGQVPLSRRPAQKVGWANAMLRNRPWQLKRLTRR